MRSVLPALFLILIPALAWARPPVFPGATPSYKAWVAGRLPGNPEGLAIGHDGRIYATVMKTGRVVELNGKGGYRTVGFVPDRTLGKQGLTTGAHFGPDGQLYVAYMWHYTPAEELDPMHLGCRNSQDVYSGIYRLDVSTGVTTPFVTKRDGWPGCFPDDIAFDAHGNLYFTDLTLSGLWKVTPERKFTLWSTDPLLEWTHPPSSGYPEGANDLVITHDFRSLIVVTDGNPAVVKVPIRRDGSAGPAVLLDRDLGLLDGVALDERGNIYVSELFRNQIVAFSPDGRERIVIATAATAPIDGPTSLVYRDGVLCVANSGMQRTTANEPRSVTCLSGFKRPAAGAK